MNFRLDTKVRKKSINMPYQVYDINKSLIDDCFKSTDLSQIEYYQFDDCCLQGAMNIDKDLVNKIYLTTGLKHNINLETTRVNHTQYNIKKLYELEPHLDNCPISLIIYLNKDAALEDNFWVDKKQVEEERWKPQPNHYTAMVMWSSGKNGAGMEHEGYFKGKGSREVLCFFLG